MKSNHINTYYKINVLLLVEIVKFDLKKKMNKKNKRMKGHLMAPADFYDAVTHFTNDRIVSIEN